MISTKVLPLCCRFLLALLAGLLTAASAGGTVLIDKTFDNVSNDTGDTFQTFKSSRGGVADLTTGQLTDGGQFNKMGGFNNSALVDVSGAAGFTVTFEVDSYVGSSDIAGNGMGVFFGIVSGANATSSVTNQVDPPQLWNAVQRAIGFLPAKGGRGDANNLGHTDTSFFFRNSTDMANFVTSATLEQTSLGTVSWNQINDTDGFTLTMTFNADNTWSASSSGLSLATDASADFSISGTLSSLTYADLVAGGVGINMSVGGIGQNVLVARATLETVVADTTPPSWTAGYPQADTPNAAGFTARAAIDEPGTAYYVVVADGATAPSAAQVKAGNDSSDSPAHACGSITLTTADTENTAVIDTLSPSTAYDVFFVAEDDEATPNLQASVSTVINITTTTPDTTPPSWTAGYPQADTPTNDGFTARAAIDEPGTAYYVVVADGATAPSAAQVKAGNDSGDSPALASGNITLGTANTENTAVITGLSAGTNYDAYFVAEDDAATPNLQASPSAVINITTNHPPVFDAFSVGDATQDAAYTGSSISATDGNAGDTLAYAKDSGPDWLIVDATTGALTGTPTNDDVGTNVFTVSVTDGQATVQATLNITVLNVNDAPVFSPTTITGNAAGVDVAYSGTLAGSATDVDAGDTLTYAKVSGPVWLSVAGDGTLSGTPTSAELGLNSFTVSVTDGTATVQATLDITVSEGLNYKVFLLGGQSNALGRSSSSGLPTSPVDLTQPQNDILFYYDSEAYDAGFVPALTTLRPGTGKSTTEFGPEVSFGAAIADALPGDNIAIIKYARGGSNLYTEWSPSPLGTQYSAFKTTVADGIAAIEAAGHTTEIVGMLWHQGESDAIDNQQDNYETNLTAFIADVRSTYGANLPFLIGEIHRSNGAKFDTVADAQIAVALADSNAAFVPATDLQLFDTYHFDAPSMVTLGERFASRYIGLSSAPTLDSISDSWDGGPVSTAASVTYTLIFSEDMDDASVSALDFENVGTATVSAWGTPTETYPGVFSLTVTPGSTGTLQLQVKQSVELLAADGGALDTTSPIADDTVIDIVSPGSTVYSDNVESSGTPWTIIKTKGGDVNWGTKTGLSPTAGTEYLYHERLTESNSYVFDAQLGGLTVAAGVYTVTFDVAQGLSGSVAVDLFGLTAGFTSGDGTTRYLEVLDPVNVLLNNNEPTHDGTFNTWTLIYTVNEGASVIGQPLGFFAELQVKNGGLIAFDNFSVDFDPAGGGGNPLVTLVADSSTLSENGGTATVTARVGPVDPDNAITVNFAFTGDAVEGAHYNASATSVTIPAGAASGSVILTATDNSVFGGDLNFNVAIDSLTTAGVATAGSPSSVDLKILEDETQIVIDPATQYQEMVGFGAALSWYNTWIYGGSEVNAPALEQLMFEDLGMDVLRLKNWYYPVDYDPANIPASSDPSIVHDQAAFDRMKDLFNAAKAANPDIQVLLSSWSPPASLKSNNDRRNGGTLKSDANGFMYDELAQYWVDCLDNLGWTPDYLSFQNEPNWTATWETCRFDGTEGSTNAGYDQAAQAIWNAIKDRPDVPKMLGGESINMQTLASYNGQTLTRSIMDVHGYHTYGIQSKSAIDSSTTISRFNSIRDNFSDKPNWMTEWSDDGIDWFDTARVIHNNVVEANTSAYIFWKLAWAGENSNDTMIALQSNGAYEVRPHYYTIKHYSKHVDKGDHRIDITSGNANVDVSGYLSADGSRITLVAINKDASSSHDVSLGYGSQTIYAIEGYQSVSGNYYQAMNGLDAAAPITLPAKSLTTMVLTILPTDRKVTLSADTATLSENGGTSTLTATIDPVDPDNAVTVNFAFTGDAVEGTDYNAPGTSLVIPAGTSSGAITLTAIDNAVFGGDLNFNVAIASLTTVGNATAGSPTSVDLTILEDETETPKIIHLAGVAGGMAGGKSWEDGEYWDDGLPARAPHNYVVEDQGSGLVDLRTPQSGTPAFPGGASLTLTSVGGMWLKSYDVTIDDLRLDNGLILPANAAGQVYTIRGTTKINAGGIKFGGNPANPLLFDSTLTGSGPIIHTNAGNHVVFNNGDWGGDITLNASDRVIDSVSYDGALEFGFDVTNGGDFTYTQGTFDIKGRSHTFDTLTIGGTQQPAGIYSAVDLGGDFTDTVGGGTIEVLNGPVVSSGYAAWATSGEIFGQDSNGDGVLSGLAFLLGSPTPGDDASGRLPTVTQSGGNLMLEFECLADADRGNSELSVQHSSDLGVLDAWASALVPGTIGGPTTVGAVTFNIDEGSDGAGGLIGVTATIDASAGADGKVFGRLLGSE